VRWFVGVSPGENGGECYPCDGLMVQTA
jgi:hypothetical protein